MFVTSSYVKVPPIDTLPEKVPSTAVTFPETTLFPEIDTPVLVVLSFVLEPCCRYVVDPCNTAS